MERVSERFVYRKPTERGLAILNQVMSAKERGASERKRTTLLYIYYYHCAADALNIAFVRLWNTEYFIISYSIRVCTGLHSGPFYVVLSRLDQIMKNNCNTILPVL